MMFIILIIIILIIILCGFIPYTRELFSDKSLKICILIISVPKPITNPLYQFQRKIWEQYYNLDQNIDCFFLECGNSKSKRNNHQLILECKECYIPGIYQKTILGLEYLESKPYDFYIRTNLNSFFIFPNLIKKLMEIPLDQIIYTGDYSNYNTWVCGNSIILNRLGAKHLITYGKNPKYFQNRDIPDDVLIGKVFTDQGINPYPINHIVYWMMKKKPNSKRKRDLKEIENYAIVRTRPDYNDFNYYQQLMNQLVDTFYH